MNNEKFYIDQKVKINDKSSYKEDAYKHGGDGIGTIIEIRHNTDFVFKILWNNGITNVYRHKDILPLYKHIELNNLELDPYGEEDWGYEEIKENIKNDNVIDIRKIIMKHDNYDDFIEDIKNLITGKNINVYQFIDGGYVFYKNYFVEKVRSHNMTIDYNDLKKYSKFENNRIVFNLFIKIDNNTATMIPMYLSDKLIIIDDMRVFNELDPYGEEIWDDDIISSLNDNKIQNYKQFINESKTEIISVKDVLMRNDNYEDFIEDMRKLIIDKEILIYEHINNKYSFLKTMIVSNIITRNNISKQFYKKFIDSHLIKVFEIKNMSNRNELNIIDNLHIYSSDKFVIKYPSSTHIDIDPYGEEDWEDEDLDSMLNEKNNIIGKYFPDRLLTPNEMSFEEELHLLTRLEKLFKYQEVKFTIKKEKYHLSKLKILLKELNLKE